MSVHKISTAMKKVVNSVPATEKAIWNRRRTAAIWLGVLAVILFMSTFFLDGMEGLRWGLAVPFVGGITFAIYTYFQPVVRIVRKGEGAVEVQTMLPVEGYVYFLADYELHSLRVQFASSLCQFTPVERMMAAYKSRSLELSKRQSIYRLEWTKAPYKTTEYYLCFLPVKSGIYGELRVIEKLSRS